MPRGCAKQLTDPTIGKLPKAKTGKRVEWFDAAAPGLALRITDKGVKTWAVYYRFPGINRKHKPALLNQRRTIGRWPGVGVAEARDQAREVKSQAKAGTNPKEARKEAETENTAIEDGVPRTFGQICDRYIEKKCPALARGWEIERIIDRELRPPLGAILIPDLKKRNLRHIIEQIAEDRPAAAYRVYEIAKGIMNWALGYFDEDEIGIEASPFANLKPEALGIEKKRGSRVLEDSELAALWRACDIAGYPVGHHCKLTILTGQRLSEVAELPWPEINLDKDEWLLPAERSKSERAHLIPLSTMAVDVLRSLPRWAKDDGADEAEDRESGNFVFSTTAGVRPISGHSKNKARLVDLSGVDGWTYHDLRRTLRTRLSELGVPEIVGEHILNHGPNDPLLKTYNLYQYAPEKRDALQRWANRVREIVEPPPENVVRLRTAQ